MLDGLTSGSKFSCFSFLGLDTNAICLLQVCFESFRRK